MAIQINGRKVIQLGTANIPVLKGDKGDIGKQGEQGIQGIPGYTPVKGIDYMTSEDKQQIADTVKADITPEITELKNGKVDKKEGYGLSQNDFTNELKTTLENLENYDDTEIKESVENIKNDLTNYYKKSETYNKEEIDNKISKIPKLEIEVVDELPTENISEEKLYLVKSGAESENLYTEYIYVNGKWEKLGEQKLNISHLATKIELEEVKTELNAEIERLTAENEQQAEQISYLDKTLIRAEASGENINIKNSAEYPISNISIDTNIKQDSREGYNDLDTSNYVTRGSLIDLTVKRQSDGSFIINGTTDENSVDIRITSEKPIITLKAGTHTFYFVDIEKSNMYNCEVNLSMYGLGTYTLIKRIAEDIKYKELTLTEDLEIYNINYHLTPSKTFNNFVLKPMIYEGAYDVNKVFEQYGSMPSIEFPSEIKTPVGKQSFVVGNKNLFPTEIVKEFIGSANSWYGADGIVATTTQQLPNTKSYRNLKANKTYTAKLKKYQNIDYIQIVYINASGTIEALYGVSDLTKTMSFIPKEDTRAYVRARVVNNDTPTYFDLQIEEGTVATEYVEHQSQTQDLDLTSELLGTIVDKEDGSYFENRYIRIILNENTQPTYFIEQGDYTLFQYNTNNVLTNVYCDKLKFKGNWGTNYNYESIYRGGSTLKNIQVKILSSRLTEISTNGIQQWLSENNLNCLCELETPTYTKLTSEQQEQWNKIKKMHTYEGVTNIYTINENGISPVINMKYVKSPKVVEENLQAQIDKINSAIVALGAV